MFVHQPRERTVCRPLLGWPRYPDGVYCIRDWGDTVLGEGDEPISGRLLLECTHQLDGLSCIESGCRVSRTQACEGLAQGAVPARVGQTEVGDGVNQAEYRRIMGSRVHWQWLFNGPAQELDNDKAQAVQVCRVFTSVTIPALRRHVLEAAKAECLCLGDSARILESGGAKVEHPQLTLNADHDVGRLDVSVDYFERLRHAYRHLEPGCSEGASNAFSDLVDRTMRKGHIPLGEGFQQLAQVDAMNKFHDNGWEAINLRNRVYSDNVLMLQAGEQLGLISRPVEYILSISPAFPENLDRNDAAKSTRISRARQVHTREGARAAFLQQRDFSPSLLGIWHQFRARFRLASLALTAAYSADRASARRTGDECSTRSASVTCIPKAKFTDQTRVTESVPFGYGDPVEALCGLTWCRGGERC